MKLWCDGCLATVPFGLLDLIVRLLTIQQVTFPLASLSSHSQDIQEHSHDLSIYACIAMWQHLTKTAMNLIQNVGLAERLITTVSPEKARLTTPD